MGVMGYSESFCRQRRQHVLTRLLHKIVSKREKYAKIAARAVVWLILLHILHCIFNFRNAKRVRARRGVSSPCLVSDVRSILKCLSLSLYSSLCLSFSLPLSVLNAQCSKCDYFKCCRLLPTPVT